MMVNKDAVMAQQAHTTRLPHTHDVRKTWIIPVADPQIRPQQASFKERLELK
jgi:hypothetical protein